MEETAIQKLNEIERAIVKIQTIEEGLECYARIGAIKEYGRKRNMGKPFQDSLVICELRAERKNGYILIEMAEKGERKKWHDEKEKNPELLKTTRVLIDFNITKDQSHQWQLLTWIPDDKFEQEIIKRQSKESSITKKDFYFLGKKYKRESEKIKQPKLIEPILYAKDAIEFLNEIENESVDLLLTDPPYITEFNNKEKFFEFVQNWIPLALSKIKSSGRAYIFTGAYSEETYIYLSILRKEMEFILANKMIWFYRNRVGAQPKIRYKSCYQNIFYLHGKNAKSLNLPFKWSLEHIDVQDINAPDGRHEIYYSTFQKPIEIGRRFIQHSTEEKDLIIDPFVGTGTFLLIAGELGRKIFGSENDKKMLKICKKRGLKICTEKQ